MKHVTSSKHGAITTDISGYNAEEKLHAMFDRGSNLRDVALQDSMVGCGFLWMQGVWMLIVVDANA